MSAEPEPEKGGGDGVGVGMMAEVLTTGVSVTPDPGGDHVSSIPTELGNTGILFEVASPVKCEA